MGREFELKYRATEEIQEAVAAKYGPWHQIAMQTTYFDTPDGALSARHITLRQRLENGSRVCTVKTPLPDGSRGEWELVWDDPETMVPELCKLGAPKELLLLTGSGITAVCGARFSRRACTVEGDGWALEIALDRGILTGGSRQIPLCELEVELKSGDDAAAVAFAQALAAQYGLQPEPRSKFRRAQALAKGE